MDFKDIRHRYYKLGKGRVELLRKMGYDIQDITIDHQTEKWYLMNIEENGRLNELVSLIAEAEKTL